MRLPTSAVLCPADAWQGGQWSRWRWLLEDWHKVLKTGWRMQQRSLQSVAALCNLLAVLSPLALRWLLIGQAAQPDTEIPATSVVCQQVIHVVIHLDTRHRAMVTAKPWWHAMARLGGYLDRTGHGPPGWQTLWKGWIRVLYPLQGVHLAAPFSSP